MGLVTGYGALFIQTREGKEGAQSAPIENMYVQRGNSHLCYFNICFLGFIYR